MKYSSIQAPLVEKGKNFETANDRSDRYDSRVLLEELAYSISHDLNTPLRQIKSYLTLLEIELGENRTEIEVQDLIDRVMDCVENIQRKHKALLTYSRIGRAELSTTSFPLHQFIMDVVKGLAHTQAINLTASLSHITIESDPEMVKGILNEILQNAINFSKENEIPQIELALYGDKKQCVLEVRDKGIGFLPQHNKKIFALFQSLHSAINYPQVGAGAGLALALRMAERIGVEIIPSGEENIGACFSLIFPMSVKHTS